MKVLKLLLDIVLAFLAGIIGGCALALMWFLNTLIVLGEIIFNSFRKGK